MPEQFATSAAKSRAADQARRQATAKSRAKTAASGALRPANMTATVQTRPNPPALPFALPESVKPIKESVAAMDLDALCEIVERDPAALGAEANSVRQLCRERRSALSSQGKKAISPKTGTAVTAVSSAIDAVGQSSLSGREIARQRRAELCLKGRDGAPALPSGRVRPRLDAPAKVEVGTTLSGQAVTGTQVERTTRVTGNESGTCRVITGTEYIGAEQFDSFCEARPAPAAAKVGMSATSRGHWVTGTEIGRSARVSGDEAGSCKTVSGTEYLGAERFGEFCESKGLLVRPDKVGVGVTQRRHLAVSGSDEARVGLATGAEAGAARKITGSQYADAGVARLTINGPSKVALTHTVAGRPVSGTEVGRSVQVTGDEAGSCRPVSGTEYLSNEQFTSICKTRPEPGPAKVGEDISRAGQRVTGNMLERTEKVTGNESGANRTLTGSQYGEVPRSGGAPETMTATRTFAGGLFTGSVAARNPKLTGDEQNGCQPVTGLNYVREQGSEPGSGTPAPTVAKVGLSESNRGLTVSGTLLGRSGKVTGNEPGSRMAISGTPYAGREQIASACGCGGVQVPAAQAVRVAQAPQRASQRFMAPAGRSLPQTEAVAVAEQRPVDFSIISPARDARGRITGNECGAAGRITGPVNMAAGLVSGTPEFRYREETAQLAVPQTVDAALASRVTGEGGEAGMRITGDNWARSGRVTGTEGHWAQKRNPTQRGEQCGEQRRVMVGAMANKERERPALPLANVTGSSGNAGKGAQVTVSGGARG